MQKTHEGTNGYDDGVIEKVMVSHRGRQTEDWLFSHQPFSEVHIILKIWKVVHVDSHLDKDTHTENKMFTQ